MKNYNNIIKICICTALALMLTACLKNDIPYPVIKVSFNSMVAEGQIKPSKIDKNEQTVTLYLDERVNLKNVQINTYEIDNTEATINKDITSGLDLTRPVDVILSLYQDYVWTIKAEQTIERYFALESQVGSSEVDFPGKRVVAYVPKSTDMTKIQVTAFKLGPADITTYSPSIKAGDIVDFAKPKKIKVSYHDIVEDWTIYVERSEVDVSIDEVNAWTRVIWASGSAQEGKDNGIEYRRLGETNWTRVPKDEITYTGGTFLARIKGLQPTTAYEVRAYSNELVSSIRGVSTESELTVPNLNFDDWHLTGKIWNPWEEGGTSYWDTGNPGAATLGQSNSVPSDETWNGKPGKSAELNTRFVGIATVGKLGAGNIFTGVYRETQGTNGVLDFGRPFTGRPTKLRGHFKYKTGPIDYTNNEFTHLKGGPDTANIYIMLTDWEQPYEIRTNPANRQLIDRDDPHIIALGEILVGKNVDNWTEFVIELQYRSLARIPRYILITASASKYGDYFTGCSSATLCIDDFSLEWDY